MGGRRRIIAFLSLVFACFVAFSVFGPWDFLGANRKIDTADSVLIDDADCTCVGKIYHKEIKNDKPVFYLKDVLFLTSSSSLEKTSIILYPTSDEYPLNSIIKVSGKIKCFSKARNEGNFDQKDYYNSLGLVCSVTSSQEEIVDCSFVNSFDILYKLKKNIILVYQFFLSGEETGFLSSVTLGDKSLLEGELKELFQQVGLAHVLAVSGLHVSVVCMSIFNFFRKLKKSYIFSAAISMTVALLYALLTGMSVSTIRAVGMFIIYLFAQVLGENYDLLTSASVMADILLLSNPLYIKNSSFIFSFSAVLAIVFIAKPFSDSLDLIFANYKEKRNRKLGLPEKYRKGFTEKLLTKLASSFVFSFSLSLALLPVTACLFNEIPTYSIFLNVFVLPLMPYLLVLGLLGGLLGLVVLPLGGILLRLCHYIIFIFELLSDKFTILPYGRLITGKPSVLRIVVFYVALLLVTYAFKKKYLIYKMIILIVVEILFITPRSIPFEIDVLDVGQGDATYISDGEGTSIFIDGGSTTEKEVGKYRILPFLKAKGVRQIDYWFVSHCDEDHYSGLLEAIESGYKIENIIFSSRVIKNENFKQLVCAANSHEIDVSYMKFEDTLVTKGVRLQCVYPFENSESEDLNEMCLGLLLEHDSFLGFFGGDLGCEQEKEIVKVLNGRKINFLKVGHHGSKNSSDGEFLENIAPDFGTISCAKKNKYGHPSKEAVDRLEGAGCKLFYTMKSGEIIIKNDKQITVKRFIVDE